MVMTTPNKVTPVSIHRQAYHAALNKKKIIYTQSTLHNYSLKFRQPA